MKPIKQITVESLFQVRKDILKRLENIRQLETEINQICDSHGLSTSADRLLNRGQYHHHSENDLDKSLWYLLANISNLNGTMSRKARKKFDDMVEGKTPKFEREKVCEITQNIKQIYSANINQLLHEVYSSLIGCCYHGSSCNHKRHNLTKVNQKFRIWYSRHFDWAQLGDSVFPDLYKLCKILDGKNESANYADSPFKNYIKKLDPIETDYFDLKLYKNGNALVTFKRLDILQIINKYGGGNALPDVMGKRYKQEHFNL